VSNRPRLALRACDHARAMDAPTAGRLFVVATPLGNLEDLSTRALRVLGSVALVACEDTRRTRPLLAAHGLATPCTSFFDHNERAKSAALLARLRAGDDVALVSDAGTPGVSDPGYHLVRAARRAGLSVVPIPGPSAAVTALCVSGLPSDRFLFVGFLPARAGGRRRAIAELAQVPWTLIVYESPLRVLETLADLRAAWGDREAFLCREATKLHEEYLPGQLSDLHAALSARARIRGEIVLVVAGASIGGALPDAPEDGGESLSDQHLAQLFAACLAGGQTRRDAVKQLARQLGLPAREVYRRTQVVATPGDGSEVDAATSDEPSEP
jgi:16S rRNA (cytidine1402-2'-O)-methyltransferase